MQDYVHISVCVCANAEGGKSLICEIKQKPWKRGGEREREKKTFARIIIFIDKIMIMTEPAKLEHGHGRAIKLI